MKKFFLFILAIIAGFIFFGGSSKSGAKLEEPTVQKAQDEAKTPPPPPVTKLESNISRALNRMVIRENFRSGKGILDLPDIPVVDSYKVEFAFEKDPLTAKEKFFDKRMIVKGIAVRGDVTNDGVYLVQALNPRGLDSVFAFNSVKNAKQAVHKIKRGDHIRLSCVCGGKDQGFLVFHDCFTEELMNQDYDDRQTASENAYQSDSAMVRDLAYFGAPNLAEAIKCITVMPDVGKAACEKGVSSCQTWLSKNLSSLRKKLKDKPDAGADRIKELNLM